MKSRNHGTAFIEYLVILLIFTSAVAVFMPEFPSKVQEFFVFVYSKIESMK